PTCKSVPDPPALSWGAGEANVVAPGPLLVPITAENRQETAPAGGATASNAWRAQVPFDRLNELDEVDGVPETGSPAMSNHSNWSVLPVMLPVSARSHTDPLSVSFGRTGISFP